MFKSHCLAAAIRGVSPSLYGLQRKRVRRGRSKPAANILLKNMQSVRDSLAVTGVHFARADQQQILDCHHVSNFHIKYNPCIFTVQLHFFDFLFLAHLQKRKAQL